MIRLATLSTRSMSWATKRTVVSIQTAHYPEDVCTFGFRESGRRFIEQQYFWLRGQGENNFKIALLTVRHISHQVIPLFPQVRGAQ